MNVLIFSNGYGLQQSNLYAPLTEMFIEIAKQGHTLYIVCRDDFFCDEDNHPNIKVYPVKKYSGIKRFLLIKDMYKVGKQIIKTNQIDLVYSHILSFLGITAATISLVNKKPFFHWLCGDGRVQQEKNPLMQRVVDHLVGWYIHKRATKMISCCDWVADEQCIPYGIDWKTKYELTPNSVNIERFATQTKSYRDSFENDYPIIIYASRLSSRKGADIFIDAVTQLIDEDVELNAFIGGAGDFESYLNGKIKSSKNPQQIKYLGQIPSSELPNYFKSSDIFSVPARYQGFGRVYIEAMASGLAVVTTNLICTKKIIDNEIDGILVEPNVEEVKKAIIKLLDDKKLREKLSLNAVKKANNYTVEKIAKNYIDIWERNI
ncbi:glycosyltransferase family 4 protein [Aliarcobacter cryaerophilus]|uniref:glycosyltransferase family 4 protein n=1 Tax=Aliarcobacter cryaerophilus TaxID=28198 RepID=UPI0021B5E58B|nr:glycosyltransferase family 4 protein [Aliarcobacter cryaerophilus]MCT7517018.1 glycosyltransferase family 4 protein [Aliarcobacter cryaerophilus]